MIRKEDLINKAKDDQLKGAYVDELTYNSTGIIENNRSWSIGTSDVKIERIPDEGTVDLTERPLDIDYAITMKDVCFSKTDCWIYVRNEIYRAIPYTNFVYNPDEDDTPKIGDNKKSCNILDIELGAKISFEEGKYDIYNDDLTIAIPCNQDIYLYIINYKDGTLPSVLVSKDVLEKEAVEKYVFEKSKEGLLYNSYYHPHQYKQVTEKVYPDVVFGSPGGQLQNINFDEYKYSFKNYKNTDGVEGEVEDNNVYVKFKDFYVASYNRKSDTDQFDINNLTIYNLINNVQVLQICPDYVQDIQEIIDKHQELKDTNIKLDTKYDVYETEDEGTYYLYVDDAEISSVIHIVEDTIEVLNIFYANTGTNKSKYDINQYIIFKDNLYYSIYVTRNEDTGHLCFVTGTDNRTINVSRDMNTIIYNRGLYVLTTNKNNDIINSNMGISGSIIPYNIFGIPVTF